MNCDYIAGWFDGEGSIHLQKPRNNYILSFPNTDYIVIQEMQSFFLNRFGVDVNITEHTPRNTTDPSKHYKKMYRITISRQRDVIRILECIKDKCITKKVLCEEAYNHEMGAPRLYRKRWENEERNYLQENYKGYGDVVKIAKHLGRTFASTENEVERLKLRTK